MEGVGESAAVLLKLVPAFVYKAQRSAGQETVLNSTEKAGRYLLSCFAGERNEVIYQLCLDRKGKLLARKRLSEGGSAAAERHSRRLGGIAGRYSASAGRGRHPRQQPAHAGRRGRHQADVQRGRQRGENVRQRRSLRGVLY